VTSKASAAYELTCVTDGLWWTRDKKWRLVRHEMKRGEGAVYWTATEVATGKDRRFARLSDARRWLAAKAQGARTDA
jgi:hypothetical protein